MAEEQRNEAEGKLGKSQKITPIATANDKTDEDFIKDYLKPRYENPNTLRSTRRVSFYITPLSMKSSREIF
jgi:hypothetical protein